MQLNIREYQGIQGSHGIQRNTREAQQGNQQTNMNRKETTNTQ